MFFFVSEALAGSAPASQSGSFLSFLPMIAFIGIIYFLLIRPQQKRQKQHQELLSAIKKGDKVITSSGMIATVSKINDQEVILEISEGVCCKFIKSAVSGIVDKKEPVKDIVEKMPEKKIEKKAEEKTEDKPKKAPVKRKKAS